MSDVKICPHCGNKKDFIITCCNCARDFHETWLDKVKEVENK